MKRIFSLFLLSIALISCQKDPPIPDLKPSEFQKNYGGAAEDLGKAVLEYSNGDLYIAGSTQSSGAGGKDVFIIKTDKNGNKIWSKTIGGAADDEAMEIIRSSDGGLLIIGYTASYGAGGTDVFLIKIDTSGALLFQKYFGGAGNELGEDILQTADGNYMINGVTNSSGSGLRDVYIIKVNASGTLLWSKTFGGTADDGGSSLCNADSGNVMLFNYTDNYGALNRDMYVIKISSTGDSLNSWLYGGAEYEEAQSIERTTDGNFLLFGHTASYGHIDHNMYGLKISGNGTVLWQNNYGGTIHDGGEHGKQCNNGGYILAGRSFSFDDNFFEQMYLVKTDEAGNTQWQKNIGGANDDAAYNMTETNDAYLLVGNTKSITNGNNDVFLVKILK
jgi:hypothetical protein